jgi:thioredoxin 1
MQSQYITNITTLQELNSLFGKSEAVVLDFWASWCGPCQMLKPMIQQEATKSQNWILAQVDVDNASTA